MPKRYIIAPLLTALFLAGCGEEEGLDRHPLEAQQFARVLILNAFSATDSAIRSVALNNSVIDSISDDRGGDSNRDEINRMRGWSIHLQPDIEPDKRSQLLSFLQSLGGAYNDLGSMTYEDAADFSFSYTVTEHEERIEVRATGGFGTK
ncbi:MAG: hypothetical protein ACJA1W_004497 [Akkermansiaceae bacterium]|jgi:hypothetical protein